MNIYTLKVTEKNTKPVIWRRVEVPGGITFSALAIVLNILMKPGQSHGDRSPDSAGNKSHADKSPGSVGNKSHDVGSPGSAGNKSHDVSSPGSAGDKSHDVSSPGSTGNGSVLKASRFYFQSYQEGIRLCEEPERRKIELLSYEYSLQDASNTFIDDYFQRMPGFSYVYGPEQSFQIDIEGIRKQNLSAGDAAILAPRYTGCSREAARLDPEKKEADGISAALQENCRIIYHADPVFMPARNLQKQISKKNTGLPGMKNPVSASDNLLKGQKAYLQETGALLERLLKAGGPEASAYAKLQETLNKTEALIKESEARIKKLEAQAAQSAGTTHTARSSRSAQSSEDLHDPNTSGKAAAPGRQHSRPKKLKELLKSAIETKDLRECGKRMLLRGYKTLPKAELAEKIANELLTKTMMQKRLMYLSDRQIAAFEKVLKAGGIYKPADRDEEDALIAMSMRRYAFWEEDSDRAVVPEDVEAAYRTWYTPQFAKKRSEAVYLLACMEVIERFYGQISLDDFYKLVRKGSSISFEEMKQQIEYLTGIWAENGAPQGIDKAFPPDPEARWWLEEWTGPEGLCVLRGNQLIATSLLENDEYLDVAQNQTGVVPYIPSRKEILEFSDHGYPAGQEECRKLRAFFENDLGEDALDAEDLTEECWEMFNYGWNVKDIFEMFEKKDIRMESRKEVEMAVELLVNLNNNTRMLHHRGHTPNEIRYMHNQGRKGPEAVLKKLGWTIPGETGPGFGPTPASVPAPACAPAAAPNRTEGKKKIYPNAPCPCGSGKKYKHCCGK